MWSWMPVLAVILLVAVALGPAARPAEAHQPRLVTTTETIKVRDPVVSQAFYAELAGGPALYEIDLLVPSPLYVSLLVPDLAGQRTDFVLRLSAVAPNAQAAVLLVLDGSEHQWTPFYEPFAGDHYRKGPEAELALAAGRYHIEVGNGEGEGKYVLAVGREERFGVQATVETLQRLPAVKRYFGKSPLLAYFNLVGLFSALAIGGLTAAVILVARLLGLRR